jgi:hypothetical protein
MTKYKQDYFSVVYFVSKFYATTAVINMFNALRLCYCNYNYFIIFIVVFEAHNGLL